jgi:hypothetical protein
MRNLLIESVIAASVVSFFSASAYAGDNALVKVFIRDEPSLEHHYNSQGHPIDAYYVHHKVFVVQSLYDGVLTLKNISLNKGHCHSFNAYPVKLEYSQESGAGFSCDILDATVETDQGSWTFTFN